MIVAASALGACHSNAPLFIQRAWPADQAAILIVTDDRDQPIERAPRIWTGSALELPFQENARVKIYARSFLSAGAGGPDLASCGARFGGNGGTISAVQHAYATDVLSVASGTAAFREIEPKDAPSFDLHYVSCGYPCARIMAQQLPTIADSFINHSVVAIDDHHAYFATESVVVNSIATRVGRIRDPQPDLVFEASPPAGVALSIAYDRGSQLWLSTNRARVLAIDLDGNLKASKTSTGVVGVASGRDGAVVSFGAKGFDLLAAPANDARRIAPLAGGVPLMALARIDRVVAENNDYLRFFDGAAWRQERMIAGSSIEDFVGLAVGEEIAVAAGTRGLIALRKDGDWRRVPAPNDDPSVRFRSAAVLAGGRFFVVGEQGFAGLWTGDAWCEVPTNTTARFEGVDVAPSGKVLFAVGYGAIYRFDLPE
jgi:hypothetical protein